MFAYLLRALSWTSCLINLNDPEIRHCFVGCKPQSSAQWLTVYDFYATQADELSHVAFQWSSWRQHCNCKRRRRLWYGQKYVFLRTIPRKVFHRAKGETLNFKCFAKTGIVHRKLQFHYERLSFRVFNIRWEYGYSFMSHTFQGSRTPYRDVGTHGQRL